MSVPPPSRTLPPEASPRAHDVVRRLLAPVQAFLQIEAASGIALVIVTAVALIWANSGSADAYHHLWHTPIGLGLGDWSFVRPLHFWVNDVLMAVFFFLVGLEIRREIHGGELSDLRRATLPLAAALGGMLLPAAIFAVLNHGRAGIHGWGVPMATDIAFAVGVLALLGPRVPPALRVLLLALAVIDDIGAIVVIAVFYSDGVEIAGLGVAALGCLGILLQQRVGMRRAWHYLPAGMVVWAGMYRAGVHPTLAGVIVGLLTPARAWLGADGFSKEATPLVREAGELPSHALLGVIDEVGRLRREAVPPTEYLIHRLHYVVAFGIMPLFALANAGVSLGGAKLSGDSLWVFLGVVLGLVFGKTFGVILACRVTTTIGISALPRDARWSGVALVGMTAGIGFTMSLFVAQLAFEPGPLLETAKLAILVGSTLAALIGLAYGALTLRPPGPHEVPFADAAVAEASTEV
ncbi:MAG: Na+/H+ antiporter NhaA [Kofleriaceae bacterium]